ncbi:MAG: PEP-CTERM sorting domain-containing protein [Acidobacteriaceae bacterium]
MRLAMWMISGALFLSASLVARADTTYTYTGNDFTNAVPPFTTNYSVSGSFTVASPFGDDSTYKNFTPISFIFTDGQQAVTNLNASSESFDVSTNASGEVDQWDLTIFDSTSFISTQSYASSKVTDFGGLADSGYGTNSNTPGTWTMQTSVAPEPTSLLLLGTALLGLAGLGWKRLAF